MNNPLTLLAIVSHICVIGILSIDIHQNYILDKGLQPLRPSMPPSALVAKPDQG